MMTLLSDLRHAARALSRRIGFTVVAVVTLGLGLGANTAIFSAVYRMLIAPVPFDDANRLATIYRTHPQRGLMVSPPRDAMDAWRERADSFEQLEVHTNVELTLLGEGEPEELEGVRVTDGMATMLRVAPIIGRMFTAEEAANEAAVVVLSETLWRTRFGGDRGVIGRSIHLGPTPLTIIGVMPAVFAQLPGPFARPQYWLPLRRPPNDNFGSALGRLRDGVTPEAAAAELASIAGRLPSAQRTGSFENWQYTVVPAKELGDRNVRRALPILLGAVGFVLLIACANVAGLLLVRLNARRREIAIRAALGARARRILVGLLAEQVLLALAAGGFGLLLALWGMDAIRRFRPDRIALLDTISLDPAVLLFAFALLALSTVLFGLIPAWLVLRQDPINGLRSGNDRVTQSGRARAALVTGQIALSVMLLVGAALLIRTVSSLQQRDLGFDPNGVLVLEMALPSERYTGAAKQSFFADVIDGVRAIPSVTAAAVGGGAPPELGLFIVTPKVEGSTESASDVAYLSGTAAAEGFLPTIGARIIAGRDFGSDDHGMSTLIVNRAFVDRFWPGQDAVGKRIQLAGDEWSTVIGVVDNIRASGPLGDADELQVFSPAEWEYPSLTLVIRTSQDDPMAIMPEIKQVIARADPDLPIRKAARLTDQLAASIARERFNMLLLTIFAVLALVLSAVGVYGLVAYTVQQRIPEIGVRIALGAVPGAVRNLFLTQGMTLTVVGLVIGLAGAALGAALMRSMVHDITPYDGVSFAAAVLVIGGTALLASWLPARRAARVDPIVALRAE